MLESPFETVSVFFVSSTLLQQRVSKILNIFIRTFQPSVSVKVLKNAALFVSFRFIQLFPRRIDFRCFGRGVVFGYFWKFFMFVKNGSLKIIQNENISVRLLACGNQVRHSESIEHICRNYSLVHLATLW